MQLEFHIYQFSKLNKFYPIFKCLICLYLGQAERQAINTTIQGSAADIAKKAMVLISRQFNSIYQTTQLKPKLVLHLHDELLYEVPIKLVTNVAKIVKKCMEESVNLSIPFPVKLKRGPSWGQLEEFLVL